MKKSIKLLVATLSLSIACVSPVFATETALPAELKLLTDKNAVVGNAISTLVTYDNQCGANDKLAMHHLVDLAQADLLSGSITEQQNYINYLKAVVGNAIETERIKKQNVNSLTDLVKLSPTFQPQLDAAIAEYNKAVADHAAADAAVINAQLEFDALQANLASVRAAIATKDADSIY